jgi:predicted glycoside hydrolase/deacetylase ChbG (UPF0249 family)
LILLADNVTMAARLIINADDFGLTLGINRAIIELHQAGVLTSATLMANGPAFDDAVALARQNPTLGVGCHIVLTDGAPVSPPHSIPTLLGPDRRALRPSLLHFVRDLSLGRINRDEIAREALAQVQKLQRAGITVTHIDTHKHTHIFPAVCGPLMDVIQQTTGSLRNPFEPNFARRLSHPSLKRSLQVSLLNRFQPEFDRLTTKASTPDGTIGISATGTLDTATLHQLLRSIPTQGTFELVCHPGYNDAELSRITTRLRSQREVEHAALLSEIPRILSSPQAPRLIHYGNLGAAASETEKSVLHHRT